MIISMKTLVVSKIREWYDIPEDTRGNHAAISDRVKYLLDSYRYIFENLSVHYARNELTWHRIAEVVSLIPP
jgi:hypothetical protein